MRKKSTRWLAVLRAQFHHLDLFTIPKCLFLLIVVWARRNQLTSMPVWGLIPLPCSIRTTSKLSSRPFRYSLKRRFFWEIYQSKKQLKKNLKWMIGKPKRQQDLLRDRRRYRLLLSKKTSKIQMTSVQHFLANGNLTNRRVTQSLDLRRSFIMSVILMSHMLARTWQLEVVFIILEHRVPNLASLLFVNNTQLFKVQFEQMRKSYPKVWSVMLWKLQTNQSLRSKQRLSSQRKLLSIAHKKLRFRLKNSGLSTSRHRSCHSKSRLQVN